MTDGDGDGDGEAWSMMRLWLAVCCLVVCSLILGKEEKCCGA
jgi:hypothetical protein